MRARWQEWLIEALLRLCGVSAVLLVFGIFLFVFGEGASLAIGGKLDFFGFLGGSEWLPVSVHGPRYGTLPLLAGTMSVTLLAMVIAVPFGLGGAIFISEFCRPATKETLKVLIEFLAAIPSVVWGFVGLMVLNPLIVSYTGAPIGLNVLNGGIILALMSVPIIVSMSEDAFRAVPDSYREAAIAMGASKWQLVWRVMLPAARNGLLAAVLLGVGRAVGETMAVLMATGHSVRFPSSLLDSARTLTATIAAEMGEAAVGSAHYQVLFLLGTLLFLITFVVNMAAEVLVRGVSKKQ
jgi:phosphate transport system permease protein